GGLVCRRRVHRGVCHHGTRRSLAAGRLYGRARCGRIVAVRSGCAGVSPAGVAAGGPGLQRSAHESVRGATYRRCHRAAWRRRGRAAPGRRRGVRHADGGVARRGLPPAARAGAGGLAGRGEAGRDIRLRHLSACGNGGRRGGGPTARGAPPWAGRRVDPVLRPCQPVCLRRRWPLAGRRRRRGGSLMAAIELDLAHSYVRNPRSDDDYALLPLHFTFRGGGAYALLGPSGCGKTTLLNCVSGLLRPSQGRILFDGRDVTGLTPQQRNIAQVFQFPVVYDTMTVAQNLAFPLRNRGMSPAHIRERVGRIAEMLDLSGLLDRRASGLAADAKQKISLGRGLVRSDVSAVLFDEPLTVIDPHLKWQLRRKLKEIHQELKLTLIYVTHDQTEALTFAEQVMVMSRGKAVQVGTPEDLFERPAHTFVGHFIGSPGMNFLPAQWRDGALAVGTLRLSGLPAAMADTLAAAGPVRLG